MGSVCSEYNEVMLVLNGVGPWKGGMVEGGGAGGGGQYGHESG